LLDLKCKKIRSSLRQNHEKNGICTGMGMSDHFSVFAVHVSLKILSPLFIHE